MSRTVTPEETEELFKVCKNNAVEYYDVQIELVDHLASLIEEQWKNEPECDFQLALKNAIKKFGTYSFTRIKLQKEKELRRKYNRLLWKFVLEFYRWPKVITTFVFTLGLFLLLQFVEQTVWIVLSYTFAILFAILIYQYLIYPKFRLKVVPWKSFLLLDYLKKTRNNLVILLQLPNIAFQIFNFTNTESVENHWLLLGISFLIVALSVLLYGLFFFIPQKIKEHFMENYAEFAK